MHQESNYIVTRSFSLRERELKNLKDWAIFLKKKGIRQSTCSFIVGALLHEYLPDNPEENVKKLTQVLINYERSRESEFDKLR